MRAFAWFAAFAALGCSAPITEDSTVENAGTASLRFEPTSLFDAHRCLPGAKSFRLRANGRSWSPGATGEGIQTSFFLSASAPMHVGLRRPLVLRFAGPGGHYASSPTTPDDGDGVFVMSFAHGDTRSEIENTTIVEGALTVVDVPTDDGSAFGVRLELRLSTGATLDVTLSRPITTETC